MASHAAARRIGGLFGQARQVLCDANHRRALLLAGLLNASSFSLVPYLSPYLVLNAGVGEAELSLVYFTGGIGSLLAVHLSGRLADRMNRYRQFLIGAALTVLITLLITQWPRSPLWATLLVSLGVFMFFPARNVPAMALITAAAQAPVRGSFMAFMAFLMTLGAPFFFGEAFFLGFIFFSKAAIFLPCSSTFSLATNTAEPAVCSEREPMVPEPRGTRSVSDCT
jgi:predicted MFS family arabinose efflux permease